MGLIKGNVYEDRFTIQRRTINSQNAPRKRRCDRRVDITIKTSSIYILSWIRYRFYVEMFFPRVYIRGNWIPDEAGD